MNRRELETFFLTLESTPALLARAAAELPEDKVRQRGTAGGFSLVEHVWHLADLEREAYGVRIRRLLTEDEPLLSNFEGDRVARERVYLRRDLAEGLLVFTTARTRNLQRLRDVSAEDWRRAGVRGDRRARPRAAGSDRAAGEPAAAGVRVRLNPGVTLRSRGRDVSSTTPARTR